jgi:alkanesulfonate monooxygenase SsuD/methylene tetrahydromethanopterin reductase-like flavin-dependent oxidoreductase (luciferase family)
VIKSWVFEFFPAPRDLASNFDPDRSARYFEAYMDLWARAEPLGFEGLFFSEHHFGKAYSPSPNLLIAQMALRTKTLRLGVMGMVVPYHQPWRLAEEIGMLDHLTNGRLEIGTAAGIPNEMEEIGLGVDEARERNDEGLEIIDAALRQTVISHHGKYWRFDNLRLTPRPLQQPFPPVWVTVVSTSSARKAAQRGAKITTGFHPTAKVKEIFEAYRDEAARLGRPAGPEQLGIRRQVVIALSESAARDALAHRKEHLHQLLKADPRVPQPGRQVLDTPSAHTFTIGDEEFIAGTPASVTEQIIGQCRELGAGHFLALFEHDMGGTLARSWELLGTEVNPVLRRAAL